jgi:hypothetical protein
MGGLRAARWLRTSQKRTARRDPVDGTVGPDTHTPDPAPGVVPDARPETDTDPALDLPWLRNWSAGAAGDDAAGEDLAPPETTVSGDLALNRPGDQYRPRADLDRLRRVAAENMWDVRNRLAGLVKVDFAWRTRTRDAKKLGPRLERLVGSGWRVLHAIPLGAGASMIDHLLIGPGGVFAFSTHEHRDARVWVSGAELRVNGVPVPYLADAIARAQRVGRLLSSASGVHTRVMPCLVMVTGTENPSIIYHSRPEGALILDSTTVIRVLKGLGGVLTPDAVERVYEAARRRVTWEIARA